MTDGLFSCLFVLLLDKKKLLLLLTLDDTILSTTICFLEREEKRCCRLSRAQNLFTQEMAKIFNFCTATHKAHQQLVFRVHRECNHHKHNHLFGRYLCSVCVFFILITSDGGGDCGVAFHSHNITERR